MNIFSRTDYRQIIDEVVAERKKLDTSFNFKQMAAFIKVPKSYLSRVIHGKSNLNTDQLFLVCQYLEFRELERNYMNLLLEYARTSIKARKDVILCEINSMQAKNLDTKHHISAPPVQTVDEDVTAYYLDPLIQITHICLAIPRYQHDQALLAADLKAPLSEVLSTINYLEQKKFIRRTEDGITLLVSNVHLPKESPVYKAWRSRLKLQSINRINAVADDAAYSFAVIFSANDKVRAEIQRRFLLLLEDLEELVGSAEQEDVYQMSFELFPLTHKGSGRAG